MAKQKVGSCHQKKFNQSRLSETDCIRPNHRNLYRHWFAKCFAILMCLPHGQAKGWLLRNGNFVYSLRFVSPLCDGSPDLWDGQPLPPEDGGRCCRGVPPPGPRLAQGGVVCRTPPTDVVHHVEPGTNGGMTCSAANVHRRGKATSRKRASFAHSTFFVSNNRSVTRMFKKFTVPALQTFRRRPRRKTSPRHSRTALQNRSEQVLQNG